MLRQNCFPLLLFSMLYVVFDLLLGAGAGTTRFPMQLLVGVVLWTFFAEAVGGAMGSIIGRSDLVRKAYFPRVILVLSSTLKVSLEGWPIMSLVALWLPPRTSRVTLLVPVAVSVPRNR